MEGDPFNTTMAAISIGKMVLVNTFVRIYGSPTRNKTLICEANHSTGVVCHDYIGALDKEQIILCQNKIEGKLQRSCYEVQNSDKIVIGAQRGDNKLTIECITDHKIERTIKIILPD